MNETIEGTIERVEQLYMAVTGVRPPNPVAERPPLSPDIDPVAHVEEQVERMITALARVVPGSAAPAWSPGAVAWNHDGEHVLAIDMPGVSREHVQIHVEPFRITVAGERRPPWRDPAISVVACDSRFGAFTRSFPVPAPVTDAQVSARLDHGVLTIRIHAGARPGASQVSITS